MFEPTDAKKLNPEQLHLLVSETVFHQAQAIDAVAYSIDPEYAAQGFLERYNINPEYAANSLVFATGKENTRKYALMLSPVHARLSNSELKAVLGSGKWSMASPEETMSITHSPLGSVGPFGWSQPFPTYINSTFFQYPYIVVGGSVPEVKFVINPHRLRELNFIPT